MKTILIPLIALCALPVAASAEIKTNYVNLEDFTDFTIAESPETFAQKVFDKELKGSSKLQGYVGEDRLLELTFTDIDMAGDVQPWRNRDNADIRYVESIYPPRIKLTYVLRNAQGEEIASGEEALRNLGFDSDIGATSSMRDSFYYEIKLLEDWARKSLPPRANTTSQKD